MNLFNILITVFTIFVLIGCSTPYQPIGILGGYSSNKISDDYYRVIFRGNQHTKADKVNEYILQRSAEITIDNKFEYFVIYDDSSYIDIISMDHGPDLDGLISDNQYKPDFALNNLNGSSSISINNLYNPENNIDQIINKITFENAMTNIVGVYKIQLSNTILKGYEKFTFSASNIISNFSE